MALTTNNKLTSTLLIGLTLSVLGLNVSNAVAAEHNKRRLVQIDTNGDGAVDLDEMIAAATQRVERRFNKKDTDEDGFVTFEEFTASGRAGTDLTEYAEEIVQCVADVKEELGSETIQVPDVDSFKTPQEKFDALDTNLDGVVELTEAINKAVENATEKFNILDADGDGLVTKLEKRVHAANHKGTRRTVKHCIKTVLSEDEESII